MTGGQPDRDGELAKLKDIAARYFEDIATIGLPAAHIRHLHPDVRWISVAGELTRDGMVHMGEQIHECLDGPFVVRPGTMTAEDNRVAVEAKSEIRMRDGRDYRNTYHFLLVIADGKITEVHEHYDSAHANEIWGPYADRLMAKATVRHPTTA